MKNKMTYTELSPTDESQQIFWRQPVAVGQQSVSFELLGKMAPMSVASVCHQ